MEDIRLTSSFVSSFTDTVYMRRSRMWSMMSLGPWNILPGDSIRIVIAEIVNGVDYGIALQPKLYPANSINSLSKALFDKSVDQSQFTFDNNFNHPDPPAAPEFTVDYNRWPRRTCPPPGTLRCPAGSTSGRRPSAARCSRAPRRCGRRWCSCRSCAIRRRWPRCAPW